MDRSMNRLALSPEARCARTGSHAAAMRIEPPPEPSPLIAFFSAPLITPVLAIPLAAFLPGMYASEIDILITLPFVVVVSLIYGYIGMLLVCLPVMLILHALKRLNTLTLCLVTTLVGGILWTALMRGGPGSASLPLSFLVGATCSLGVTVFFCVLGGLGSVRRH